MKNIGKTTAISLTFLTATAGCAFPKLSPLEIERAEAQRIEHFTLICNDRAKNIDLINLSFEQCMSRYGVSEQSRLESPKQPPAIGTSNPMPEATPSHKPQGIDPQTETVISPSGLPNEFANQQQIITDKDAVTSLHIIDLQRQQIAELMARQQAEREQSKPKRISIPSNVAEAFPKPIRGALASAHTCRKDSYGTPEGEKYQMEIISAKNGKTQSTINDLTIAPSSHLITGTNLLSNPSERFGEVSLAVIDEENGYCIFSSEKEGTRAYHLQTSIDPLEKARKLIKKFNI